MNSQTAHMTAAAPRSLDPCGLVGSAFLWSWVDALYGGAFFSAGHPAGAMPEFATWGTFVCASLIGLAAFMRPSAARRFSSSTFALLLTGIVGVVASVLFFASSLLSSWTLLAAGAVLGGAFMGTSVLGWGGVYCREGMRGASLYVSGGFACAMFADITFSFMEEPASALLPATLPFIANLLLSRLDPQVRSYAAQTPKDTPRTSGTPLPANRNSSEHGGPAALIARSCRKNLGISVPAVCSMALIMFGLGYMQHHFSFAQVAGPGYLGSGTSLQIVRGLAALALFITFLLAPKRAGLACRVGLLAIVAGFSLMPLLYGTEWLWVSGATILAGYTTFDVLVWVIVAQAAYTELGNPVKLVCSMRLVLCGLFCVLGGLAAIALSSLSAAMPFPGADALTIGYLMTIAVVLVSSSHDVWELFDARRPGDTEGGHMFDAAIDALSSSWGLTARERDVLASLAMGRTQPWIAENLGISENTVGSHVRHIYAKSGINSRQGIIDQVLLWQSPEQRDVRD